MPLMHGERGEHQCENRGQRNDRTLQRAGSSFVFQRLLISLVFPQQQRVLFLLGDSVELDFQRRESLIELVLK